jgi:vacuolar-type H+-ATPase subunit E/Vma4
MESAEKDKTAIISGIETDAKAEEQEIIKEAQKQADEKLKYFDNKSKSIVEDARKEASLQAEAIRRRMVSGIKLELKRGLMRIQQDVIQLIMGKVEKKLNLMIGDTNYRAILEDWIVEAAIGLGTESALLNASEKERVIIDGNFIAEVGDKVFAKTGSKIALQLTSDLPLKLQGVVLTAANKRTAFNNQVKTRISRKERDIQMKIYKTLFADERKESL